MINSHKEHWETVYKTKEPCEVSWTQQHPTTSLDFIHSFNLPKTAKIIDIGGGDSKLADYLLDEGFENITVLDISAHALEKAKNRLGNRAQKINWIVSDVTTFDPNTIYDLWHDRAAFHFLISTEDIEKYLATARKAIRGYMTIATFSDKGPEKCSGLPITQYSENKLAQTLANGFDKIRCITEDHTTPFDSKQQFLFCSFKRQLN